MDDESRLMRFFIITSMEDGHMEKWLKKVLDSEGNSLTDKVAFATFVVTVVAFLLREFYYLYQWGFYSAIGVDKSYIDVETTGSMYYILMYVGLAIMLVVSNYVTYAFVEKKDWGFFVVFLLIEKLFLWFISVELSNEAYVVGFKEMFSSAYYKDYLRIGAILFITVVIINVYGLIFGILKIFNNKKIANDLYSDGIRENGLLKSEFKVKVVFTLVTIIVGGIAIFGTGQEDGYEKQDYKIIIEQAKNVIEVDEKYSFNHKSSEVKVYPILYENNEIYVVSKLFKDTKGNHIEFGTQEVISKIGVETEYVDNIYEFGQEKEKSEINNTVKAQVADGESKEGGNKMLNTIVGVVLGAILTFFVGRYQDNKKEKKRRSHAASLLYYDLLSIANYLEKERSSVNIRYTNDWQTMVTNCDFLKDEQVQCLYSIYDLVYNYNYHYGLQEKEQGPVVKESIYQYKKLNEIFFDTSQEYCDKKVANEEYGKILKTLQKYCD